MTCLDEIKNETKIIIGVRDYSGCTNPESDLFIQDLPGISIRRAANIVDEEYQTGLKLLKACVKMATKHVFDEFIAELLPYFDFNAIVETRELKDFNSRVTAKTALERGIVIKRWRSEMARTYIDEVYIGCVQDGTITLKIIDGCTTTELAPVDVKGGCVNTIKVNYRAESENVKIVFDQTDVDTYNITYNQFQGCGSCSTAAYTGITVKGWNGTAEDGNAYGVGVLCTVRCYEENIFCLLLPRMSFLFWYKSGIVFLNEFLASDRVNELTLYGKEDAAKLLANYEAKYKEKYAVVIAGVKQFMQTTKGDCLKCNTLRNVQSLP